MAIRREPLTFQLRCLLEHAGSCRYCAEPATYRLHSGADAIGPVCAGHAAEFADTLAAGLERMAAAPRSAAASP